MSQYNKHQSRSHSRPELPSLNTKTIRFDKVEADLFSQTAENTAQTIAANRNSNKPTQLRRFYDEIVMWDNKLAQIQGDDHENRQTKMTAKFEEYLPFIRMLNAKVAYARGRKLVDDNFAQLMSHCLEQVNTPQQMQTFKLFMEAFMGFYKVERPRD